MIDNWKDAKEFIVSVVDTLDEAHREVATHAMRSPGFWTVPAAKSRHHAVVGGSVIHIAQILQIITPLGGLDPHMNFQALIVAAVWHDLEKVSDYIPSDKTDTELYFAPNAEGKFEPTRHYDLIGHLAGSAMEYHRICSNLYRGQIDHLHIEHLILSHHGRKEWGSPVEPKTPEAWLLHSADMLSSQYYGEGLTNELYT